MTLPKILITGGTGFIGSQLALQLLSEGYSVRILSHSGYVPPFLEEALSHKRLEMVSADLNDHISIQKAVQGVARVVHLAWSTVPKNATDNLVYDVQSNVVGSIQLFMACVAEKVEKVVFVSSGGTVYGVPQQLPILETHPLQPISGYGLSKVSVEQYLHLFGHLHQLPYLVLRVANVYGRGQNTRKGQGVIGIWANKLKAGEPLEIWGSDTIIRDYVHVRDTVQAIKMALFHHLDPKKESPIFNVGTGRGYSLKELLDLVQSFFPKPLDVRYIDQNRPFDVPANVLCIEKIKNVLGWQPQISIEEGLGEIFYKDSNPD
ncbi:NAD-dependent epimerase/dehydratase family protein [Hugenholtzia roseola]|uniref:NAD-dependent epimerase/dehydratase family protein n=1 Tax=Hugenholtzia roseola TaxID=1002 RepID=UPI00041CD98A|nr:NAD-dependent epimerase/dehydratase family protein [Hugenholtzia roseola]